MYFRVNNMHVKEQKKQLAKSFARSIGFRSLKDTKTVIRKSDLYPGIEFIKKHRLCLIKLFKGRLKRRLLKPINVNDVIKDKEDASVRADLNVVIEAQRSVRVCWTSGWDSHMPSGYPQTYWGPTGTPSSTAHCAQPRPTPSQSQGWGPQPDHPPPGFPGSTCTAPNKPPLSIATMAHRLYSLSLVVFALSTSA